MISENSKLEEFKECIIRSRQTDAPGLPTGNLDTRAAT